MDIKEIILMIVGSINMLGLLAVAFKKYPAEKRNLDAQAAKGFAEAAKLSEEAARLSATRAETSAIEFSAYKVKTESRIDELEDKVLVLESEIRERDVVISDLQDWAERLVYQVKSFGGTPVKIRSNKGNGK